MEKDLEPLQARVSSVKIRRQREGHDKRRKREEFTCKSAAERAMAFREDGCPINEEP